MTISFKNKALILLISTGILMFAGGLFITYKTKKAFDNSAYWTDHTHNVIFETQNILSTVQDLQLGGRGYIITGDSAFLETVDLYTNLTVVIQKLKNLTANNPHQQTRVDSVASMSRLLINYIGKYTKLRNEKGFSQASKMLASGIGTHYINRIKKVLHQIQKTEYNLLRLQKDANQKSIAILHRVFIFLLCSQAIFLLIIFLTVRYNIRVKERNEKNEIRFRSTLDKMFEGVEIIGFDFRYLYVNTAYEKQVRYTKDELLGHTVMEKFPGIEQTEIFKCILNCLNERVAIQHEDAYTFPDNTQKWFEISFQPVPEGVFILSVDITEKKEAGDKVRQSEMRFRSLIENSYDIVSITDKNFMPFYRSPAAVKITGLTNDEREKKGGIEQTHPDDVEGLRTTMKNVLNNPGKSFPVSFRTRHKEGHYIYLEGVITNMLQNEAIKGIVSNFRDITETRKAEESIRLSEERFRSLIENSYDIVSILDEDLRSIYRSPSSIRITGYSNKEKDKLDSTEQTHPDDIEGVNKIMQNVFKNPMIPYPLRLRMKHKDGHYILLQGMVTNMLHNNAIKGIVTNFRDITENQKAEDKVKQSEKIYKTIASSIPGSVICLLDREYRYFLIEGDILSAMGYSKEKLLGKKIDEVISGERIEEVMPLFLRVLKGESFSVESYRSGLNLVYRYVPLKDESNNVFAIMVVLFDVSELKKAQQNVIDLNIGLENKIKERTLELEIVNKELEAFSYSVAHDLRTPLRAINGYATMIEEDYTPQLDDEGKRLIAAVQRNAKRMGTLIDDLLTFSRLGRKEIQKSVINMKEITESSLIDINLDEAYPGRIEINNLHPIMADFSLMKHVMTNLLSNAIKYSSKKEKPHIELSSRQENDKIIYAIRDNGVGFDMVYADKLFGVFQRLHSDEEFDGTGVGLAIVQRVIHRHGGQIWASSQVNQGTTFYFSLPNTTETDLLTT